MVVGIALRVGDVPPCVVFHPLRCLVLPGILPAFVDCQEISRQIMGVLRINGLPFQARPYVSGTVKGLFLQDCTPLLYFHYLS